MRGAQAADRVAQSMDRADREAAQLEQRTRRVGQQMSVLGGAAQQLGLQLAAAFSIGAVIRANDAWVSATNQIRLVTQSAAELRNITEEVFQLSQRTASRFEGMTGLYASIQRAAGEAIGSQREVLRITETIAKLAAASGGPEGSRNAALFQLRQLLQGSVVQAQEFNSLIDGTPLLVQAIADSLGVTRGELRRMVLDGRLAVTQVIAALQEQADEADAIFSQVAFTMGDAFTRLQNAFQKLVGTNLGPIFAGLVSGISFIAEHMDALIPLINGVAAAFAVAFAPAILTAFGGAVLALFTLIEAHPMAALVGGIVAAASAVATFADQITIARHEISGFGDDMDETLQVTVTLKDYFDATFAVIGRHAGALWQSITDGAGAIGDAVMAKLTEWLPDLQGWALLALKIVMQIPRSIIGAFTGMVEAIAEILKDVPGLLINAFTAGANGAIGALEGLLNRAVDGVNQMLGESGSDIRLGAVEFGRLETDFEARGQRVASAFQRGFTEGAEGFDQAFASITGALGGFFNDVNMEAHNIALQRAMAERRAAQAAAEEAAAAAAAAGNDALAKQIRARQQLFAELEAQLALNEREFAIYQETEELLRQFPDFYRAAAAGAENVAEAARAAAEADARRLDSLRRQIAAQSSLKQLATDELRQTRLIDAARGGADALELEERTLDLLEEHADLYERMGKGAEDAARTEAARQLAAERTLDALTDQAERAREIARAPALNLVEGLTNATDDFWTNFVDQGFGAFDDLGDALGNVFKQLQADMLRAMFDPIRQALTNAVQGAFGGKGGGGFSLGGFDLSGLFGGGKGGGKGGGGILGQITGALGQIFNGGGGAAAAGQGFNLSGLVSQGSQFAAIYQIGSAIGTGILDLFGKNFSQSTRQWTSVASGLFGGGIGGILGGLFGKEESSYAALIDFQRSGAFGSVYGKPNEQTGAAVTESAQAIQNGLNMLKDFGIEMGAWVDMIVLRINKRTSNFTLRDANGNPIDGGAAGGAFDTGTMGDAKDLATDVLTEILKRSKINDPVLDQVMQAMTGAGKGFEETLDVLGKLKQVLPATDDATSQWAEALETLNATFADLRASTADVAGVAAQLDQAFASAKGALRDRFAGSIEDAITAIENPLELQLKALLKTQGQRLADATALGADTARVMHLNELELLSFIESAGGSAEAFKNLNAIFADLIAKAEAAGQATAPLVDAYNQARAGVVDAFDKSVADQFGELTNPTLNALRNLLDAQKARLEQARAIGANIVAVERLNALEQQSFFKSLSDEQKSQLGEFLGLIESFTGRIGVVLGQLQDELGTRIDQTEQMRNDLLQQSDTMRQLAENLTSLRQGIVDRYGALSPMAGVEALRERFAALAQDARGGNDSALQALGQVGQQLIEASRALYGSTTTFRGDYDLVTQVLEEAAGLAGERADALTSQAETLLQQRDLLIEIRDILSSPDPSLTLLEDHLDALDQNQDVVAALLRQYLQLQAQQSAQQIDLGSLISGATQQAQTPPLPTSTASQTQTPVNPSASGATPTSTVGGGATSGVQAAAEATAQMVAVLTDVMQQGLDTMTDNQERTNRELRNLNDRLGVGGAAA